jgi:hypothetical protein
MSRPGTKVVNYLTRGSDAPGSFSTLAGGPPDTPSSKEGREGLYNLLLKHYTQSMAFAIVYLPQWCWAEPGGMHNQMHFDVVETGLNCAYAGPREMAKTATMQSIQIYNGVMLRRMTQMHISRDLESLGEKFLADIIEQFETNRILTDDFQLRPGRKQRSNHFEMLVGKRHPTKITFKARGFGGSVRGLHESLIILDDIESTKDSPTVMLENYVELHGTVFGATAHSNDDFSGQVVIVGNYLNEFCSLVKVMEIDVKQHPDVWIGRVFSALETGTTRDITGVEPGESTWPGFISTEDLLKKRAMMNAGGAYRFEIECMNMIVSIRDAVWTRQMFTNTFDQLPDPYNMTYRVAIDSAETLRETGDETAIVTWGKCLEGEAEGRYYFIDAHLRHMDQRSIAREAIRQYIGFGSSEIPQCDTMYLENRTVGTLNALGELILEEARTENVAINLQMVTPGTGYGDKRERSRRASPIGRDGRIFVPVNPKPDQQRCMDQMCMFSGDKTSHLSAVDDGHDACVWALNMLQPVTRRDSETVHIEIEDELDPCYG